LSAGPQPAPVEAVVLAAGAGSRFGGEKLLAPLHGRPVLAHVLATVRDAREAGLLRDGCVTVRSADHPAAALARQHRVTPVVVPAPARGLSESLRAGLGELARHVIPTVPQAAVILLGDQPRVPLAAIAGLVAAWRGGALAARARYAAEPGVPGHPLLLDRRLWPLAAEAQGDSGLGAVLRARGVTIVPVDVPGGNPDVDTAADLTRLEDLP